jgi:hypothetical protein
MFSAPSVISACAGRNALKRAERSYSRLLPTLEPVSHLGLKARRHQFRRMRIGPKVSLREANSASVA